MSRREPPPIAPRLLSAEQAAAYLGYATTALLANIPVQPIQMTMTGPGSQPKYDRRALDAWLDRLSGLSVPAAAAEAGAGPTDDPEAQFANWRAARALR